VTCSFVHSETCSSYGLRVAQTASSLPRAIRLILGRLGRCKEAALYRVHNGIMWAELYDCQSQPELEKKLDEACELPASRAVVFNGAAMVATNNGDPRLAGRCRAAASAIQHHSAWPVVRDGKRLGLYLRRRLLLSLSFLAAILAIMALALPFKVTVPGTVATVAMAILFVRRYIRRSRRFDRLLASNEFVLCAAPSFRRPPRHNKSRDFR
jgi:hypothetical protein